jgi:hypothetical protein
MRRSTRLLPPKARGEAGAGPDRRTPYAALLLAGLTAVLLLTLCVGPALAVFPDMAGSPYSVAVDGLAARGIVGGRSDGTFGPSESVMRAQFAKMIDGTMSIQVTEGALALPFTDMGTNDPTNLYPHDYVAAAFAANITTGTSANTFAPWDPITRAQMITMAVRAANSLAAGKLAPVPAVFSPTIPFFSDIHSPTMNQAESNGLLAGLVGFSASWDPEVHATRGECAQVLWNLLGRLEAQPVGGGPFLTFDELKPTAPIDYTISLNLTKAKAVVATAQGLGTTIPINDMVIAGHLTAQIVAVDATTASLRVTLNSVTLPPDLGKTDLSTYLPLVLTMTVAENGLVQSIRYSSAGKPDQPLNTQQMTEFIPLLAPLTQLLFVPNFSVLKEPGQSMDITSGYSVPGGAKVVDLSTHATLESLQGGVAVLSYSMAVTNINTTIIVDIMPLLAQLMETPPATGETATLVVALTGKATAEGSLSVEAATGLPVATTSAARLELRAGIVQAPPQLAELVPNFNLVSAVALDARLGVVLGRQ